MSKAMIVNEQREVAAPVTPAQMLQIAVEQGADLDKLEKLMELQERWDANNAKKAFVRAMSDFRAACPPIVKTRTGHNTRYAGLAESIDQIKDLLAECGLSHSWRTEQSDANVRVICTVTHVDGHSESTSLAAGPDSSGSKNSIQAIGSTVSYLQRYTLFAILGLASQEMDSDGNFDTPPDAIEQIQNAKDMDELHKVFKQLWNKYPKARKELTGAKDMRKREIENA